MDPQEVWFLSCIEKSVFVQIKCNISTSARCLFHHTSSQGANLAVKSLWRWLHLVAHKSYLSISCKVIAWLLHPVQKPVWLPFLQPALLAHGVKRRDAAQGLPNKSKFQEALATMWPKPHECVMIPSLDPASLTTQWLRRSSKHFLNSFRLPTHLHQI